MEDPLEDALARIKPRNGVHGYNCCAKPTPTVVLAATQTARRAGYSIYAFPQPMQLASSRRLGDLLGKIHS